MEGLNLYSRGRVLKIASAEGPMILRVDSGKKTSWSCFIPRGKNPSCTARDIFLLNPWREQKLPLLPKRSCQWTCWRVGMLQFGADISGRRNHYYIYIFFLNTVHVL